MWVVLDEFGLSKGKGSPGGLKKRKSGEAEGKGKLF